MSKAVIWTIVVVVVVGGGIWWWAASRSGGVSSLSMNSATSTTSNGAAATSTLPQGNSDQSIGQEMTDINAQMSGLSSDTANVNESMNDQPVQQAE